MPIKTCGNCKWWDAFSTSWGCQFLVPLVFKGRSKVFDEAGNMFYSKRDATECDCWKEATDADN